MRGLGTAGLGTVGSCLVLRSRVAASGAAENRRGFSLWSARSARAGFGSQFGVVVISLAEVWQGLYAR